MIVTLAKSPDEIGGLLKDRRGVFLVACSGCAEAFGNGGHTGLHRLRRRVEAVGKTVVGEVVVDFACEKSLTRLWLLKRKRDELDKADCVLVASCGIGAQCVSTVVAHKPVFPACNSITLGGRVGQPWGPEMCAECGDCTVHLTAGICVLTRCAKGLLNGPCGGAVDGQCEVNPDRKCAWVEIWERLAKLHRQEEISQLCRFRDHSRALPSETVRNSLTTLQKSVVEWEP